MPQNVALVTPSHAFDAARVRFLRESFAAAGVEGRHVVVVAPEDRAAFAGIPGVELLTTADVLPAPVEAARRRGRTSWRRALWRDQKRAMSGWWSQQWVKLAIGSALGLDAWVCVDSDVFAVRPFDPFSAVGELHEFVDFPVGPEIPRYLDASASFLGLGAIGHSRTYVGQAVPMHGATVSRMLRAIEERHGRAWWEAMLDANATEYTTYGVFARHVDGLRDVTPVDRRWCWLFYDFDDSFESRLRTAVEEHGVSLGMVHSRLGVDPSRYRDAVARVRGS